MNLVDANVLLCAVNEADPKHEESREWLDAALGGLLRRVNRKRGD